jgi:hypothetical protein
MANFNQLVEHGLAIFILAMRPTKPPLDRLSTMVTCRRVRLLLAKISSDSDTFNHDSASNALQPGFQIPLV